MEQEEIVYIPIRNRSIGWRYANSIIQLLRAHHKDEIHHSITYSALSLSLQSIHQFFEDITLKVEDLFLIQDNELLCDFAKLSRLCLLLKNKI